MSPYHAKKRLGQNFLKSESIINKIIEIISPSEQDIIIEIGPGQGALTQPLVQSGAHVLAVEFDRDMINRLKKIFSSAPNVEIINSDILKYNPEVTNYKLVGNLPYNITSPVLEWTVNRHETINSAFFMMQKEVAERLSSVPGTKNWSPLAIFTQLYFNIEPIFDISPKYFSPPPKVTSMLVKLTPIQLIQFEQFSQFELVVRTSFTQRRKTLLNNLTSKLIPDSSVLREIMEELGLDERVRAEQISTEQFLTLTSRLSARKLLS